MQGFMPGYKQIPYRAYESRYSPCFIVGPVGDVVEIAHETFQVFSRLPRMCNFQFCEVCMSSRPSDDKPQDSYPPVLHPTSGTRKSADPKGM